MEQNIFLQEYFRSYLPTAKYIKHFNGTTWIDWWKSHGISEKNIEHITKSGSNFAPTFVDHHALPDYQA